MIAEDLGWIKDARVHTQLVHTARGAAEIQIKLSTVVLAPAKLLVENMCSTRGARRNLRTT